MPASLSKSTPRSGPSISRDDDCAISTLRAELAGHTVLLYGFDSDLKDPVLYKMGQLLKASITNIVINWYGLQVVTQSQKASIIIANEADPATIARLACQTFNEQTPPSILVLCSHSSRFDRSFSQTEATRNTNFVAKPVGPLKLAKALMRCLQQATSARKSALQEVSNVFDDLALYPYRGEISNNSQMAADTENACRAIVDSTPNASSKKHSEFPFPTSVDEKTSPLKTHSTPADNPSLKTVTHGGPASLVLANMELGTKGLGEHASGKKLNRARILLVDDNKINLALLRTYLRKRKYELVDEAQNGLEAVEKVQERGDGYDVIFMDISMPVLNGFDATRQIRAIEGRRQKKVITTVRERKPDGGKDRLKDRDLEKLSTPALVIALTGLASSRDQNEAFASGIDLYLTKPVAFKEVGKILDNWVANRERDARGEGTERSGDGNRDDAHLDER
ncbi:hypothetical protein ACLOAV_008352 [Pseudogymnoascus australis]